MNKKGKDKLVQEIKDFIKKYQEVAINEDNRIANNDVKCYKRIRALADMFTYEQYSERTEEINNMINDLWVLYYYFKNNQNNNKTTYENMRYKYRD